MSVVAAHHLGTYRQDFLEVCREQSAPSYMPINYE